MHSSLGFIPSLRNFGTRLDSDSDTFRPVHPPATNASQTSHIALALYSGAWTVFGLRGVTTTSAARNLLPARASPQLSTHGPGRMAATAVASSAT